MEIFGLKSKSYGCFELKYLTLLMMLIPCSLTQDNIPSFNVTCDSTGLYVKIAFSKPFSGIAYAKGYRFDPLCSVTESSALNRSLTLPLKACGTYVQGTNHPCITNTVVIQQHPLIRTANDLEKSLICSLQTSENFLDPPVFDKSYESNSLPLIEASSDIELGSDVFSKDSAKIFDYTHTNLTIFQLLNRTIYNDFGIKNCIAHDEGILDGNASVRQITSLEGCFSLNSENSSSLTIIETDEGLMAYVDLETLGMEFSGNFYFTCEVVFCKTKCECSEIQQQTDHPTSLISHKLTKRSADNSSEMFSLKQYEARTRYLKSTVKALMDNIMEQRKQNDKKSKLSKRVMRLDDSSFLSETNSVRSVITPTEIFSPEPVSNDFYNIEPHLIDIYYDYDSEDSHHDYLEESYHTTDLSTVDYDMVVVTLPGEFKDNGTKTSPAKVLQGKGTTILKADIVSSVNDATKNPKTVPITTTTGFPTIAAGANGHLGNCIPRSQFIIVIVVMGFFMGCLLMVGCGMVLYIRKEKKRNRLNDFLLYSIGF